MSTEAYIKGLNTRIRNQKGRIKELEAAIGSAIIDLGWSQIEVNGAVTTLDFLDHIIKRLLIVKNGPGAFAALAPAQPVNDNESGGKG